MTARHAASANSSASRLTGPMSCRRSLSSATTSCLSCAISTTETACDGCPLTAILQSTHVLGCAPIEHYLHQPSFRVDSQRSRGPAAQSDPFGSIHGHLRAPMFSPDAAVPDQAVLHVTRFQRVSGGEHRRRSVVNALRQTRRSKSGSPLRATAQRSTCSLPRKTQSPFRAIHLPLICRPNAPPIRPCSNRCPPGPSRTAGSSRAASRRRRKHARRHSRSPPRS